MIQLNDKYYLDSDVFNFILLERSIIKDENSKNFGQERFDPIAYCGTLEQVRSFIFEKEIRADINLLTNIDKCIELKDELMRKINESNISD